MFNTYFPSKNIPFLKSWRKRRIAAMVRRGEVPPGISREEIWEALRDTPHNATEMFGFVSAKVYNPDGTLRQDLGLQSVKSITIAFAKQLADALCATGSAATGLSLFNFHAMGAGSGAEGSGNTALGAEMGIKVAGSQTHGATSNVYSSTCTIAATTTFGCREFGIFNTLTGGILLDRSLVTNIALNTGDEVVWTYQLTINSET
jgi:hypothetical protein